MDQPDQDLAISLIRLQVFDCGVCSKTNGEAILHINTPK